MAYKPRIKLLFITKDSTSTTEVKDDNITTAMVEAAQDLVYTMLTGKKRPVMVTGTTITAAQIDELYAGNCECRPLRYGRNGHGSKCSLDTLTTCDEALTRYRDGGVKQRRAREKCAALYNEWIGARPIGAT